MTKIWKRACAASELSDGETLGVVLDDEYIALYRVNEEIFATDNVCPHAFALLSDGFLEGHVIECPLHGAMFDVRNGKCQSGPYEDIKAFQIELRDGEVYVSLDAEKVE
jgi:NAD(P)H-dependent nitrite reductase small subunit